MRHKSIFVLLLLLVLTTSLTGCSMDFVRGIVREYEDNKESIKSEFQELKDSLKDEVHDWVDSISQYMPIIEEDLKDKQHLDTDNYIEIYKVYEAIKQLLQKIITQSYSYSNEQ